jgi:type I restriction enzyme S subunit
MRLKPIKISDLADVKSGGGAPQDAAAFSAAGHPFVRAGSLIKLLNGADENSLEKIAPAVAKFHRLNLFPAGTVLFAKSGMSATKGYIYSLKKPAYVVNHLAALVPFEKSDSSFLVHALEKFPPTTLIKDPAYPSIRLGDIDEFAISAPTQSADRVRVAKLLDAARTLLVKRRRSFATLEKLSQSIFLEMFGNPADADKSSFITFAQAIEDGFLADVQDGNHGEKHPVVADFSTSGVPFITANCFESGVLNIERAYKLPQNWLTKLRVGFSRPGDVLLTHKGTIGEVAVAPSTDKILILSPQVTYYRTTEKLDASYLAGYFRTPYFHNTLMKEAKQSTRDYVGITRQKSLPLLMSPPAVQKKYAGIMSAFSTHLSLCHFEYERLESLFRSVQQRAFEGKI